MTSLNNLDKNLEDDRYLLPIYRHFPINIAYGKGVYLYDDSNKHYLDMASGIAVNALGYQHPVIQKAILKQIKKYLHLSNYFVSDVVLEYAKMLVENSFASKVFFGNSGTEVNEATIKLARKYGKLINPNKYEIVSLENSFHGRTIGGLSLTGQIDKKQAFEPLLPGVSHVKRNDILDLRKKVNDNTCLLILELVQGESGVELLSTEFVNEAIKLSKQYQFLIAIDEVQTGLLRTSSLFTYMQYQITPDILTLAKSLGGGLPLGAMLVSDRLAYVLNIGEHGTTFGGNPLACSCGLALFKKLCNPKFQKHVKMKGEYLIQELSKLKVSFPTIIQDVRGLGMMIGIECGKYSHHIQELILKSGVIINVTNKTVIRLLPPFIIKKEQLNEFLKAFQEVLFEIHKEEEING